MKRIRWMTLGLGTALLLAVALPALNNSLDAQDKKDAPIKKPVQADANNPFAGKVLLIQKKLDQSPSIIHSVNDLTGLTGYVIENPSVIEVAGIRCLTGEGIERIDGKPAGPRISVPMESIGAILEFDDVDAFKKFEEQQTEKMMIGIDGNVPAVFEMPQPVDPRG